MEIKMETEGVEMEMEEETGEWRCLPSEAQKVTGRSAAAVRDITDIDPNMGDFVGPARTFK